MRLQALGVVFAMIIVPLIMVLSYYLNLQIKTITKQNEYDNDLLAATYDAMSSFEINTANEDLSTVSDSLRTIIEASSSVFINTLSTNLGISNASKAYVEPYIPALLYTLYDGYYIYSNTKVPEMFTDSKTGVAISIGDEGLTYDTSGSGKVVYDPEGTDIIKIDDLDETNIDISRKDYGQQLYIAKDGSVGKQLVYDGATNQRVTANINNAKLTEKKVLKSYMPYSAKYIQDNINITVIYTLDNYVTIEGYIGNVYYTKSGYLIPLKSDDTDLDFTNDSLYINRDGVNNDSYLKCCNQADAKNYIKEGNKVVLKIGSSEIRSGDSDAEGVYLYNEVEVGEKYNYEKLEERIKSLKEFCDELASYGNDTAKIKEFMVSHHTEVTELKDDTILSQDAKMIEYKNTYIEKTNEKIREMQYKLDKASAICYYTEAYIFTKWVTNTLGNLKESSLVEISGQTQPYRSVNGVEEVLYDFSNRDTLVFSLGGSDEDSQRLEIAKDSTFYTHKLNVIRNSIQYNLNVAMSVYNKTSDKLFDYQMPILNAAEWEKILTNVSLVSFMQGYRCGFKTYNNYRIVTSSNNELLIEPNELYYVPKDGFNNGFKENENATTYHKIDCEKFVTENTGTTEFIAFPSKEVKYDKIYNNKNKLYHYDHRNLACYDCVNDRNYDTIDIFATDTDYINFKTAYYIGVGKERNNIYKMNSVKNSQGRQTIFLNAGMGANITASTKTDLNFSDIKEIRVTHKSLGDNNLYVYYKASFAPTGGEVTLCDNNVMPGNESTFVIEIDPQIGITSPLTNSKMSFDNIVFKNNKTCTVNLPSGEHTWTEGSSIGSDLRSTFITCVEVIYK